MARYIFCLTLFFVFAAGVCAVTAQETGGDKGEPLILDFYSAASIGISNSFDLREIRARETIYDLSIYESLREYFPSLTFSYMQTEEVSRRETDNRESRLTVETEVPIYDGGKRRLNYDVARLNALLARNDYRIAMNQLIVRVREQYLNLIKLRETVEIHKKTLEHGAMQLAFIQKEFELGDATKLAVMEIDAKVREIELNLKSAVDEYENALKKFRLLLKIGWRTPVVISGDLEKDFIFLPVSAINDDELIGIAVKMRKEIESSTVKYQISQMNNRIKEYYYLPDISAGFNYSLTGEEFPPREKGWGVSLKFTSRLFGSSFSGGTGYNESGNGNSRARSKNATVDVLNDMPYKRTMAESRIEAARAGDELNVTKETISVDIAASCSTLRSSWDMIDISKRRLELYDSQLEIERLKASMGESRRYDLVEKEIERGEAAVDFLNSRIKYLVAASSLELATGMDTDFLRNYLKDKGEKQK